MNARARNLLILVLFVLAVIVFENFSWKDWARQGGVIEKQRFSDVMDLAAITLLLAMGGMFLRPLGRYLAAGLIIVIAHHSILDRGCLWCEWQRYDTADVYPRAFWELEANGQDVADRKFVIAMRTAERAAAAFLSDPGARTGKFGQGRMGNIPYENEAVAEAQRALQPFTGGAISKRDAAHSPAYVPELYPMPDWSKPDQ